MHTSQQQTLLDASPRSGSRLWIGPAGLTLAIGAAYFVAAQFSLTLLAKPDGLAVFWPGSGLAAGTLVAIGSRARLPVAIGVAVASAAASLLSGQNLLAAAVFSVCNAGQALLVAWLIERRFGRDFRLESLSSIVGFLAAGVIGPAISAIPATMGFILFHSSEAPVFTTWLNWLASDALGVIMVAPLFIGLGAMRCDPPEKWELLEGILTLAALALMSAVAFSSPLNYWYTVLPLCLLLPVLLAAHCRPVFAAAAALILGFAVVWTTTFGMTELDGPKSLHDRTYAARATLLAISTCMLVLAALFAERRRNEAAINESSNRLQLALDAAKLGVWSVDFKTESFQCDARDSLIHGHPDNAAPQTIKEARAFVHADDITGLNEALLSSKRISDNIRAEYRLAPIASGADERWVAIEGAFIRAPNGERARLLGVSRDITDLKRSQRALAERNLQLALAGKAALVGSYSYDVNTDAMQVSEGYVAVHDLAEGTSVTTRSEWRARTHPEDVEKLEDFRLQAFHERRGEYGIEYRIIRGGREVRWIESRSFVLYRDDGCPQRVVGVDIDITERKQAQEHRDLLNAELDHRAKNLLATVGAIITQTQNGNSSMIDFVSALDKRIASLARVHELLSCNRWQGVSLREIVGREFAPYAADNITIKGPNVMLIAEAVQPLAMVLHELTTNAAKYGAFSNRSGRVLLRWWWHNGTQDRLAIDWRESGGPAVASPSRYGYGTSIVRELIPFELGGEVDLIFAIDGLRCRMEVPGEWISSNAAQAWGSLRRDQSITIEESARAKRASS
jgi:two-component sensor histidine kinase/integral membrane sensor domain MASE1